MPGAPRRDRPPGRMPGADASGAAARSAVALILNGRIRQWGRVWGVFRLPF